MYRKSVAAAAIAAALAGCQPELPAGRVAADVPPPPREQGNVDQQTVASVAGPQVVESYRPPLPGTVFTWRNNWTSLPPVISYRVDGVVEAGETQYLKMTAVGGLKERISAFYDTRNFALKGYRDAQDKALVTFKPLEERYQFPLKPGDKWVSAWKSFDHRKQKETNGGGVVEVIGFEMLELPAGTFRAVKVRLPTPQGMPARMTHYIWFSPELGVTVKELVGNGQMNWTQILEKVERPSS